MAQVNNWIFSFSLLAGVLVGKLCPEIGSSRYRSFDDTGSDGSAGRATPWSVSASPNTVGHSEKLRLVVMIRLELLVQLAHQMKQQGPAVLAERQIAELIENHQISMHQTVGNLAGLPAAFPVPAH